MINQITTGMNSNVYASVQSSNGAPYYVTKPLKETQKQEPQSAVNTEDLKDTVQVNSKNARTKKVAWYTVGVTAMAAGLGVLFFSKGLSKSTKNLFNRIYRNIVDKNTKIDMDKNASRVEKFWGRFLKYTRGAMTKSKILFNGAPLKDALAMKYIKKFPKLKKFSDKVSDYFEKISVKTSKHYYNKTLSRFDEMYAEFNKAGAKIPETDRKIITERISNIQKHYNEGFSETARNHRMQVNKSKMMGWDDEVYNQTYGDLKGFWNKQKSHKPFISEIVASDVKVANLNEINDARILITNGLNDNYLAVRNLMDSTDWILDPTDKQARSYIKEIGKTLDKYHKETKAGKDARHLLFDNSISKNLDGLSNYIATSNKYDKDITKETSDLIQNVREVLTNNKKGEVQEIIAILKKNVANGNLSEKEYRNVKKVAYKATKSLNKSVDMEADKLFDKIRDLAIGSAPMDLIGLISSLGVVAWGLLNADNNDERISATLKYGIPAVGGVATTLYCTLGLVSAGPSLIIGLISGALINKLGIEADHLRKKYTGKQFNANEESIAQISMEKLKEKTKEVSKVKYDINLR